jgi:DNA-directed RNA polymerase III subunit RPC2
MKIESDQEIVQLVGSEKLCVDAIFLSLQDCRERKIFTAEQALQWLGSKIAAEKKWGKPREKVTSVEFFFYCFLYLPLLLLLLLLLL